VAQRFSAAMTRFGFSSGFMAAEVKMQVAKEFSAAC
jgi:hypothetical protein